MLASWRYRPHNSFMERFDPRARWIFSLSLLFSVTMFWDARFLLFFFIVAFAWYFSARVPFEDIKRGWLLVGLILFTMIVVNTVLTGGGAGGVVPPGGHEVWPNGIPFPFTDWRWHFGLTYERLWFAVCQLLRILSICATFLILPYTMDPRVYGVTFRRLGLPDKFAYSMELAVRYIPTIARDFGVTFDSQRARGYEIERVQGGIFKQIARVAPLIVPVTMNSILMGEDVVNAMDLRCFGQNPRTWLYELKYQNRDYILIGFSVAILLASITLSVFFNLGGFTVPPALLALVS